MESRDSEGVPFASLESLWSDIWEIQAPERCQKSDHVTIRKITSVHIHAHEKFTDYKNAILFELRRKITKLSRKTVSEQWHHQALSWPSWIDARHQYILLVSYVSPNTLLLTTPKKQATLNGLQMSILTYEICHWNFFVYCYQLFCHWNIPRIRTSWATVELPAFAAMTKIPFKY